jgi:1-acyl-sn-glycerol-3-phosphate acyltransferase
MIARIIAATARFLTGARPHWRGGPPVEKQCIYFANHTSNLDFVLLWATLPTQIRETVRPIAASDYWQAGPIRHWLARHIFRAVLIERRLVTRENNPLYPMLEALTGGSSLIIFPEGTRNPDGEVGDFRPGLYHLAKNHPGIELVPVFIENLNRVLPKGEILPVPILCSVNFGASIRLEDSEPKPQFLSRARAAVVALKPA